MPSGIYKRTEENLKNLRLYRASGQGGMKGKHHSLKSRKRMRKAKLKSGHMPPINIRAIGIRHWKWKGGLPKCKKCNKILSCYTAKYCSLHKGIQWRGEKNYNWKGRPGTERHQLMQRFEYRIWREAVFARDNWICQKCFIRGGKLEADHIKPWALYPELRYAIDNGRTLCVPCHRDTKTWGYNVFKMKEVD